jgi:thymidylate synthase
VSHMDLTWVNLVQTVISGGENVTPRQAPCLELIGNQTTVDMTWPILTLPERKLGYKFQAAEAAWILSGDNKLETLLPYSKEMAKFSDDGVTLFGAYGPKFVAQLPYVIHALAHDLKTRQAVVTLWREAPPPSRDIPCTLSLQWLIRNSMLHCIVSMRSSDIWLGYPYDVFSFSMVSAYILLAIRPTWEMLTNNQLLTLGKLYLTAGSQHLYMSNFDEARKINEISFFPVFSPSWKFSPEQWFKQPKELIDFLWECATTEGTLKAFEQRGSA